MFGLTVFASIILAVSRVQAHATFQDMWINGVDQAGKCVRPPASNSPVQSVTTNDLTCNVNGANAAAGNCAAAAGDTLIVEMHQQPGDRSCSNEAIGGDHWGPTIIYMAKVDDLTTSTPWTASWFKVNATGLINANSNPQYWATQNMNDNCGKVWFKIPSDIAAGNYLVRAEVIALHVASSVGGAQFYMSCYQLTVSGGGSANPAGVKFPGAYSATDPGILINIHYPLPTSYTIPGPAVYTGGGSSGSSPSSSQSQSHSSTQSSTTRTTTSTSTVTSTTTSSSSSSTSTGTAAQYAQCGGNGYTGPTTCASPYKCVAVSPPYYSQCQ